MTRTARAVYPRALTKDRSESKNGLDKSAPKHGSGSHNWGSLADEVSHELYYDEDVDTFDNDLHDMHNTDLSSSVDSTSTDGSVKPVSPKARRASVSVTDDDKARARSFRTGSFSGARGDIDLSAIARTSSAVSTSPPKTFHHK